MCVIVATTHRLSDARRRSAVGASSRPPPSPPRSSPVRRRRRAARNMYVYAMTRHDAAPRGATLLHVAFSRSFSSAFVLQRIDSTSRHADDDVHVRRMKGGNAVPWIGATLGISQLQGRRTRPCRHRRGTTNVINGPRTYRGLATGGGNDGRDARQRRRHRFPIINI